MQTLKRSVVAWGEGGEMNSVSSLDIMTKATIHMANCFLCEFKFSFLFGKYLGMVLLDHTVRICLTL